MHSTKVSGVKRKRRWIQVSTKQETFWRENRDLEVDGLQ